MTETAARPEFTPEEPQALPLADMVAQGENLSGWDREYLDRFSKVSEYGGNYPAELATLLQGDHPRKLEYVQEMSRLYGYARHFSHVFPARYTEGVERGVQNLLADGLYALNYHISHNDETDVSLPLNGGGSELPLHLEDDEPLQLLKALGGAMGIGTPMRYVFSPHRHIARSVAIDTIKVSKSPDYALYRFAHADYPRGKFTSLPFSLYIRPYGDVYYDPKLEYGRPGEGVEASISYVVDTSGGEGLMEVGKHRRLDDDQRISIRLDREGVKPSERQTGAQKDPTLKEGTLSLDVGSVLGKDEWTSTKLGRFLAWGNYLRTRQQGTDTHLNHMTEYFSDEDGDADVFALEAAKMIDELDKRSVDAREIQRLFAGRTAVKRAAQ